VNKNILLLSLYNCYCVQLLTFFLNDNKKYTETQMNNKMNNKKWIIKEYKCSNGFKLKFRH